MCIAGQLRHRQLHWIEGPSSSKHGEAERLLLFLFIKSDCTCKKLIYDLLSHCKPFRAIANTERYFVAFPRMTTRSLAHKDYLMPSNFKSNLALVIRRVSAMFRKDCCL